jgi:hypothetical protein
MTSFIKFWNYVKLVTFINFSIFAVRYSLVGEIEVSVKVSKRKATNLRFC